MACMRPWYRIRSLHPSLTPIPVNVIDPRLDIWVASSDSYRFYLLDKLSTASRWGRHSRVPVCLYRKDKKKWKGNKNNCNAWMFLPVEGHAARVKPTRFIDCCRLSVIVIDVLCRLLCVWMTASQLLARDRSVVDIMTAWKFFPKTRLDSSIRTAMFVQNRFSRWNLLTQIYVCERWLTVLTSSV